MLRIVITVIITILLGYFSVRGLKTVEDPISSLMAQSHIDRSLFDYYQHKSVYRDRLYLKLSKIAPEDRAELISLAADGGFKPLPFFDPVQFAKLDRLAFLPLLSPQALRTYLSPENLDARAHELAALILLPGSAEIAKEFLQEPLQLQHAVFAHLQPSMMSPGGEVLQFQRETPLDYERAGLLYEKLIGYKKSGINFISGDFFAVENYQAIRDDIAFSMAWSLPLCLGLFWFFTGKISLLFFLTVGSFISYATGVLAVRLFYHDIYVIVFAFTSTFIGFNNEYLVHLSGIERVGRPAALVGLGSAIGTTLIGFLILLGGEAILIRQMAIVSIGGMIGFIIFMLIYQDVLGKIRFRHVRVPHIYVSRNGLLLFWTAALTALYFLPKPDIRTDISSFKVSSPLLEAESQLFSSVAGDIYALVVNGDPYASYQGFVASGPLGTISHPFDFYPAIEKQAAVLAELQLIYAAGLSELETRLAKLGLSVQINHEKTQEVVPMPSLEFLRLAQSLMPYAIYHELEERGYLYVRIDKNVSLESLDKDELYPVSPQLYYNRLLTNMGRNLLWLFIIGFGIMSLYLVFLQRSLIKVLYIFTPLLSTVVLLMAFIVLTGRDVNIVHAMGFSLIIALALDYSSIAVSSHFADTELTKVLLTGLSALVSFGVICFAKHPFLVDLGVTVTLGSMVALLFTLFVRIKTLEPTDV